MATNTYTHQGLGLRWSATDATAEDYMNVAREHTDVNRWTLEQLLVDPDVTPFTLQNLGALTFTGNLYMGNDAGLVIGHSAQINLIGAGPPDLQVLGTGNFDSRVAIGRWSADADGPELGLYKSYGATIGGTPVSGTRVRDDDVLGTVSFLGDDGGTAYGRRGATITAKVDGTPGTDDLPTRLEFAVTPDGASGPAAALTILNSGAATFTGTLASGAITSTGVVTGTGFTIGSAAIVQAELEVLDGATLTTAELNILDGVTSTAAELNILDGVTSTAAEINLIDGGTARGTTAVASGDGILINDAGTMRMTNVDTVSTYFASHSVGGGNIVTTGALASGSIASTFGTINTGSSTITTTGEIAAGSLDISGNVDIDGITNLDVVDIDGAVHMASTLNVATATNFQLGGVAFTGTMALLNTVSATLTDNSMADTLHRHSELSASDGTPDKVVSVNAAGELTVGAAIVSSDENIANIASVVKMSLETGSVGTITSFGPDNSTGGELRLVTKSANGSIHNSAALVVDASGNVGIGTSPDDQLHIKQGTGTNQFRIDSSGGTGGSANIVLESDRPGSGGGQQGGKIDFYNQGGSGAPYAQITGLVVSDTTGMLQFSTDASPRLTIDTGGNVGINETDPANKLEIRAGTTVGTKSGHIMLTSTSGTDDNGPQIVFSESGASASYAGGSIGFHRTGSNSVGDLVFGTRATTGDANTTTTERMRIESTGNVLIPNGGLRIGYDATGYLGVGTDDPDVELHIETATAQPIIQVESTGSNSYPSMRIVNDARTWQMYVDGTDSDKFKIFDVTANSPRLAIDSSGNVGIGTTSPGDAAVTNLGFSYATGLHIHGGAPTFSDATNVVFRFIDTGAASNTKAGDIVYIDQTWRFRTLTDAGGLGNDNVLFVDGAAGNVGIGTSSPDEKLDVEQASGSLHIKFQSGNDDVFLNLSSDTGNAAARDATIRFLDATVATYSIGVDGSDSYKFKINEGGSAGASDQFVMSGGDVGIGETDPDARLHTNGSQYGAIFENDDNIEVAITSTSATRNGILWFKNSADSKDFKFIHNSYDPGFGTNQLELHSTDTADIMVFNLNGNVGIGTASPGAKLTIVDAGTSGTYFSNTTGVLGSGCLVADFYSNAAQTSSNAKMVRIMVDEPSSTIPLLYLRQDGTGDIIQAFDGGTQVFTINDTGDVGIGATDPSRLLTLANANNTVYAPTDLPGSGGAAAQTAIYETSTTNGTAALIGFTIGGNYTWNQVAQIGAVIDNKAANAAHLVFRTYGAKEAMRITNAGDVGIGTVQPSARLDITTGQNIGLEIDGQSQSGGQGTHIKILDGDANPYLIKGTQAHNSFTNAQVAQLSFNVGGSDMFMLDSNGNIGMGVQGAAEIPNNMTPMIYVKGVQPGILIDDEDGSSDYFGTLVDHANSVVDFWYGHTADLRWKTTESNVGASPDVRMTLTRDGDLGLGHTNPDEVAGSSRSLMLESASGYAQIYLGPANSSPGNPMGIFGANEGTSSFASMRLYRQNDDAGQSGGEMQFWTKNFAGSDSVKAVIDANGNVGIGVTPTNKVHIFQPSGSADTDHALKWSNAHGTNGGILGYLGAAAAYNSGELLLYKNGADPTVVSGNGDSYFMGGDVGIGTASFTNIASATPDPQLELEGTLPMLYLNSTTGTANRGFGISAGGDSLYFSDLGTAFTPYTFLAYQRLDNDLEIEVDEVHFRSDVNHGHTTITDNDTYFRISEISSDGGAFLMGFSKASWATMVRGIAEAPDSADTTGSVGVVDCVGTKTDGGTGWGDAANGENIFSIRNGGAIPTTRVIIKGNGDVHASDTSWATALDDIPDAIAGRAYTTEMALRQGRGILGGMQITNPALVQRMEDAGIVTHAELPGEGTIPGHRFLDIQKSIKFSWDMGFQNFQWMAEIAKVLTDKQRSKLPLQMRDAFTMLEEKF